VGSPLGFDKRRRWLTIRATEDERWAKNNRPVLGPVDLNISIKNLSMIGEN